MYFGAIPILCLNFSSGFLAPCATLRSFVSLEIEQTCTYQSMLVASSIFYGKMSYAATLYRTGTVVVPLQDSSSMIAGVVPVLATIHNTVVQYCTGTVTSNLENGHS